MPKRRAPARRKPKPRAARVQVPRVCSEALSLLLSAGASRSMRLTLGDAVRELWNYAKAQGLKDGPVILCNEALRRVFGCGQLGMTEIPAALSKHLSASSSTPGASSSTPGTERQTAPAAAPSTAPEALLTLSPALTSLLRGGRGDGGNRQAVMGESELLRRLGQYVAAHGLRDKGDRRRIHCDGNNHCTPPHRHLPFSWSSSEAHAPTIRPSLQPLCQSS